MPNDETWEKVKALLTSSYMIVGFGLQLLLLKNKLNLNHPDPADGKKTVDVVKAAVDDAYDFGAKASAFLASRDRGAGRGVEAKKLVAESIREICDYAASRRKLGVVLETFDRDIAGRVWGIGPLEDAAEFAVGTRKNYPQFGLIY